MQSKISTEVGHPEAVRIHATTMERYVYLWSIENVSNYLKNKRSLPISQTIYMRNGDMELSLNFYPVSYKLQRHKCNCKTHYKKHFIRLKAILIKSKVSENIVEGKFQILDKLHRAITPKSPTETLCADAIDMEIATEQSLLEELPDDLLKLQLEFKVAVPVHRVTEARPHTRLKLQQQTYKELPPVLQTKEYLDTMIIVGNTVIPAHQAVLEGASPVFAAMFDKRENNLKLVDLSDLDVETTDILLNFIYRRESPTFSVLDDQKVVKLLETACKYVMNDLKLLAVDYLMNNLNSSIVIELLMLADAYDIIKLKETAIEYICKNKFDFSIDHLKNLNAKGDLLAEILLKSFSLSE